MSSEKTWLTVLAGYPDKPEGGALEQSWSNSSPTQSRKLASGRSGRWPGAIGADRGRRQITFSEDVIRVGLLKELSLLRKNQCSCGRV